MSALTKAKRSVIAPEVPTISRFVDGGSVTVRNDMFSDANGVVYQWFGSLPHTVPAGSSPATAGGYGLGKWLTFSTSVLDYVFTDIKDGKIYQSDLRNWISQGILANKRYFSIPTGDYELIKDTEDDSLIELPADMPNQHFIFDGNGSVFRYNGSYLKTMFYFKQPRGAYVHVKNMQLYCNSLIGYGFFSDGYIGESSFEAIDIRNPAVDGYNINCWQTAFRSCMVFKPARHGFAIGGDTGTGTSALFDTCWVKSPGTGDGYSLRKLTYLNFINSAFDGEGATFGSGRAVIGINGFVYGLTINGMGTENWGGCLIKQYDTTTSLRELIISGWYVFKMGTASSKVPYMFDFYNINKAIINGIGQNEVYVNNGGVIRANEPFDGFIISSDTTAGVWEYTGTLGYGLPSPNITSMVPVKSTAGLRTFSVATFQEFQDLLEDLRRYRIDSDVRINLTASIDTAGKRLTFANLVGTGTISIVTSNGSTLGSATYYRPILVQYCDPKIIFRGIKMIGFNNYGTLVECNSSNIVLKSVTLQATGVSGKILDLKNNSVAMISSDCTTTGTWQPADGSNTIVTDGTCFVTKTTATSVPFSNFIG